MSKFLPLSEYLSGAKKILRKVHGPSTDEDSIAYVAHYMMVADAKFDEELAAKHGGSRYGFRYNNGRLAALACIKRRRRLYNSKTKGNSETLEFMKVSERIRVEDRLIIEELKDIAQLILSSYEYRHFKLFLDNMPASDIARECGVSRQAVYQSLNRSFKQIREAYDFLSAKHRSTNQQA